MNRFRKIGRGLFGAAVLSALGVGATALLPSPAQARGSCVLQECHEGCLGNGAQYGYCNYYDDSCECVW